RRFESGTRARRYARFFSDEPPDLERDVHRHWRGQPAVADPLVRGGAETHAAARVLNNQSAALSRDAPPSGFLGHGNGPFRRELHLVPAAYLATLLFRDRPSLPARQPGYFELAPVLGRGCLFDARRVGGGRHDPAGKNRFPCPPSDGLPRPSGVLPVYAARR